MSWVGLNSSNRVSRLEVTSMPSRTNCLPSAFGFRCTEDKYAWISFDAPQQLLDPGRDEESSSMAFGLLICQRISLDDDYIHGLLLQQLPSGKFQRVGAFTVDGKAEWHISGYFTPREIVIV
jgi:hypothetical protein